MTGIVECSPVASGSSGRPEAVLVVESQLSTNPSGKRWVRHFKHLVDLIVDDATQRSNE
jgi:hypothetical protein